MAAQPFNWSGYFQLAEELAKSNNEASLRSALSRAYYYVYHLALDRAKANGFTIVPGEGFHKQLWRNYGGSPEPACQKLAIIADRLKEKRERADYHQTYNRIADDIPDMLEDAREFAVQLQRLNSRFPNSASVRR
jgi:uncharacterized protein (UPF0332 family)